MRWTWNLKIRQLQIHILDYKYAVIRYPRSSTRQRQYPRSRTHPQGIPLLKSISRISRLNLDALKVHDSKRSPAKHLQLCQHTSNHVGTRRHPCSPPTYHHAGPCSNPCLVVLHHAPTCVSPLFPLLSLTLTSCKSNLNIPLPTAQSPRMGKASRRRCRDTTGTWFRNGGVRVEKMHVCVNVEQR
jgi:hypothetical protein